MHLIGGNELEVVIITGMSGSGKSGAAKVLEDIGYFCIDNMPPELLPKFIEISSKSAGEIERIAIVTDIRGGELFFRLSEYIDELIEIGISVKLLYLDASDNVIIQRYKETRRKHPLDERAQGNVRHAVQLEREILAPIREKADYYFDTSLTSLAQLKDQVKSIFLEKASDSMIVNLVSFGFKYGAANEADLIFDVRCLPNPFYLPELKNKTGLDAEVRDYVMSHDAAKTLRAKLEDLTEFLLPLYVKEGKSQLVIGFGCTGGKHRSVTFVENMRDFLEERGIKVRVSHRDISKN